MLIAEQIAKSLADARKTREIAGRVEVEKPSEPTGKAMAFKAIGHDDLGVIVGIGGAAGSPEKLDLDGEFLSKADLQRMAMNFCASPTRKFKANHQEDIEVQLVASWVGAPIIEVAAKSDGAPTMRALAESETLTKDMNVVGIDTRKGNERHWFVAVKPTDPEVVEIAKAGGIAGFSWSGLVSKTEV